MYNKTHSMSTVVFWRYSVLTAIIGGAIVFFFPYYAITVGLLTCSIAVQLSS